MATREREPADIRPPQISAKCFEAGLRAREWIAPTGSPSRIVTQWL